MGGVGELGGGFEVEPGGPEVALFGGDDEHEVVSGGSAFDGVVGVVHDGFEEIEGAGLLDGEVELELWTHGGELHRVIPEFGVWNMWLMILKKGVVHKCGVGACRMGGL